MARTLTLEILRLMRPHDWVKNVFVLPALVFSRQLDDVAAIGRTAWAVAAFCLLSSGIYAINDALDAESDRRHPIKRSRPVAAGTVSATSAFVVGLVLVAAALVMGFTGPGFSGDIDYRMELGFTLALYAVLQAAYNLKLKRAPVIDVVTVAIGFALRAAAGAAAVGVGISIWLLMCVFFLCLYLGFIKRLCDKASAEAAGADGWTSPAGYHSRDELNWLLGITAALAVVTYLMYALSEHAHEIFGSRSHGFALLIPLVLIAIHRFYRRAAAGQSDSPLSALREDKVVLASIILYGVGVLVTLYAPGIELILGKLFVA